MLSCTSKAERTQWPAAHFCSGQLKAQNLQLLKHTLWDTLHIKWLSTTLNMNGKRIDLPENVNIPLWDKIKLDQSWPTKL